MGPAATNRAASDRARACGRRGSRSERKRSRQAWLRTLVSGHSSGGLVFFLALRFGLFRQRMHRIEQLLLRGRHLQQRIGIDRRADAHGRRLFRHDRRRRRRQFFDELSRRGACARCRRARGSKRTSAAGFFEDVGDVLVAGEHDHLVPAGGRSRTAPPPRSGRGSVSKFTSTSSSTSGSVAPRRANEPSQRQPQADEHRLARAAAEHVERQRFALVVLDQAGRGGRAASRPACSARRSAARDIATPRGASPAGGRFRTACGRFPAAGR